MGKLRRGSSGKQPLVRKLLRGRLRREISSAQTLKTRRLQRGRAKPRKTKPRSQKMPSQFSPSPLERSIKKRKRHTINSNSRSTAKGRPLLVYMYPILSIQGSAASPSIQACMKLLFRTTDQRLDHGIPSQLAASHVRCLNAANFIVCRSHAQSTRKKYCFHDTISLAHRRAP